MAKQVLLSQKAAELNIHAHVEPKACFMWEDPGLAKKGVEERYENIPGTGCAHWVAHKKKWDSGQNQGNGCSKGFLLRVDDIIEAAKPEIALKDVKEDSVWAVCEGKGKRHCGIVTKVEPPTVAQKEYDDLRTSLKDAIDKARQAYKRANSLVSECEAIIKDFEKSQPKAIEACRAFDRAKNLVTESEAMIKDFEKSQKGKGAFDKGCTEGTRKLAAAHKQIKELEKSQSGGLSMKKCNNGKNELTAAKKQINDLSSFIDAAQKVYDTQELK